MRISTVLFDLLSQDSATSAIVGTNIRPVILPQSAGFPAVIYHTLSIDPNSTKSGVSTNDVFNIQLDIYAKAYDVAEDLALAIRNKLDRHTDTNIKSAYFEGQQDGGFEETHEVFKISQNYKIRSA